MTPVQVVAHFRALPGRRAKLQKLEPGAATALAKQARNTLIQRHPSSRQQHREDSETYYCYCYCYTSGMLIVIVIVPSVIVVIAC